jgi:protoporphyrinogen oxidase
MRVLIIGGGPSGLKCAFNLLQLGHEVFIFEREPVLGGLARSFELHGTKIERYYHFICMGDTGLINMIRELGLDSQLRWKYTRMGVWRDGKLYPFTSVLDVLRFPPLPPVERLKYLWAAFRASLRKDWSDLENVPAVDWLRQEFGPIAYEVIWKPLMQRKFGPYTERVSAAWIWARIKRLADSRTRFLKRERLGYLLGGSETLIGKLAEQVAAMGGHIYTKAQVDRILIKNRRAYGLYVDGSEVLGDAIISTVPLPHLIRLLPEEAEPYQKHLMQTKYLGIVCVVLRMTERLSPYFWINVSGDDIPFPGIIEYTNLNPRPDIGGSILYIPNYLPREHPYFTMDDEVILRLHLDMLDKMFPHFKREAVTDAFVFRENFAQPVCEIGFTQMMVAQKSPIQGLFVTENSQLHPHDRTISQTFDLADKVTQLMEIEVQSLQPLR